MSSTTTGYESDHPTSRLCQPSISGTNWVQTNVWFCLGSVVENASLLATDAQKGRQHLPSTYRMCPAHFISHGIYVRSGYGMNLSIVWFVFTSHLLSSPHILSLVHSRNSYPGDKVGSSPPLPTTYGTCFDLFIARRVKHFLPSSIRSALLWIGWVWFLRTLWMIAGKYVDV